MLVSAWQGAIELDKDTLYLEPFDSKIVVYPWAQLLLDFLNAIRI